jgi:P pilus assembly protein, pilin FimA
MIREIMALGCLLMTIMSHAETQINVAGKVIAAPCVVAGDTVSKQVDLPATQAHALTEAGSGGDWIDFYLELDNCPVYLQGVTVNFSGTPDENDGSTYKNNGTAGNVSLQLASDKVNYGNGSALTVDIDSQSHKAMIQLAARIYSPVGHAVKGTVNSVVSVNFTYQ